jgi:hypothetical protein
MSGSLNISMIEQQLCLERLESPGVLSWLEKSYRNPLPFWQALKETHDGILSWPGKSIPFANYDFYHDIVVRNQRNTAPAFCWHDRLTGWQKISYSQLGSLVKRKESVWLSAGVQPGKKVCIVLPLELKYLVYLLTALKIGATVSTLPPQGNLFLRNRLEALSPEFVATDEMYLSMLTPWRENIIPEETMEGGAETDSEYSHTYPTGEIVSLCFDPSSEIPHVPRELTSDAAYLCPLRDGLIALGIRPGDVLAAPGFHFLESQPALLLACLLNGGTYLNLEAEDVSDNPELLTEQPIRVLGVSRRLRDILLQKPVKLEKPLYYWFRNPAESLDIDQWQSFIEALELEKVYSGNVKIQSALGGCSLFSTKRQGQANVQVLPSPGVQFGLADPAGGESEAVADYGLFSAVALGSGNGEKTTTASILVKSRREYLYVGSGVSRRGGRTYPQAEVLAVIQNLPEFSLSSVVEVPSFEAGSDPVFVLLVFIGGKRGVDEAGLIQSIFKAIEREMGKEFLPDRIHFFPLFPRGVAEGELDHHWCREQYLTGGLFRKSREEIYRTLAQLREYVM